MPGGEIARLDRALDFAMVSEHAENIGEVDLCTDRSSDAHALPRCAHFRGENGGRNPTGPEPPPAAAAKTSGPMLRPSAPPSTCSSSQQSSYWWMSLRGGATPCPPAPTRVPVHEWHPVLLGLLGTSFGWLMTALGSARP